MNKRCLKKATKEAILAVFVALFVMLLLNTIFQAYPLTQLIIFSLMYGVGTHMGYYIGFNYKIIPAYFVLLVLLIVNVMLIVTPIITQKELNFDSLQMAIFFNMAYSRCLSHGRAFFKKLQDDDDQSN